MLNPGLGARPNDGRNNYHRPGGTGFLRVSLGNHPLACDSRGRRRLRSELLTYAVLGALAGYFAQNRFLFDTPATAIYRVFLVAWVSAQEREPASEQPGVYPVHSLLDRNVSSNRLIALVSRPIRNLSTAGSSIPSSQVQAVLLMLPILGLSLYHLNYHPYMGAPI